MTLYHHRLGEFTVFENHDKYLDEVITCKNGRRYKIPPLFVLREDGSGKVEVRRMTDKELKRFVIMQERRNKATESSGEAKDDELELEEEESIVGHFKTKEERLEILRKRYPEMSEEALEGQLEFELQRVVRSYVNSTGVPQIIPGPEPMIESFEVPPGSIYQERANGNVEISRIEKFSDLQNKEGKEKDGDKMEKEGDVGD